jgi:excisionase family DNA binding protein
VRDFPVVASVPDSTSASRPICVRPKEAARLLGMGHSHLYKLMKAGKIPYRKDGAATLIDPEALRAYRDSLPVVSPDMKPTGPLLGVDVQRLAIERARESEPEPDFAVVYSERFKLLARDVAKGEAEARAFDYTVVAYRTRNGGGLQAAKQAVTAAIKRIAQP